MWKPQKRLGCICFGLKASSLLLLFCVYKFSKLTCFLSSTILFILLFCYRFVFNETSKCGPWDTDVNETSSTRLVERGTSVVKVIWLPTLYHSACIMLVWSVEHHVFANNMFVKSGETVIEIKWVYMASFSYLVSCWNSKSQYHTEMGKSIYAQGISNQNKTTRPFTNVTPL